MSDHIRKNKPPVPSAAAPEQKKREIDFRQTDLSDVKTADFPADLSGEFRVHFSRQAHQQMMSHAATTSEVELCGVLVGDIRRDSQGPYLEITGAIEAQGANNYGSQVTFTHEAWSHIHAIKDERYPDKKIVGWYHTHPGFGVFLSSMDMFIQENFFAQPYQVAVVVETKQNKEGCFYWSGGECVAANRYWVGSREVALATGGAEAFDPETSTGKSAGPAGATGERRQAGAPQSGDLAGISTLTLMIMSALLVLAGVFLGRMMFASSLQQMISDAAESEVLANIDSAARSQLALQDIEQLQTDVKIVRDTLPPQQPADQPTVAALAALDNRLNNLRLE